MKKSIILKTLSALALALTVAGCSKQPVSNDERPYEDDGDSGKDNKNAHIELYFSDEEVSLPVGGYKGVALMLSRDGEVTLNPKVSWKISDPAIATVNEEGLVTGISPGDTKLFAYYETTESFFASIPVHILYQVESIAFDWWKDRDKFRIDVLGAINGNGWAGATFDFPEYKDWITVRDGSSVDLKDYLTVSPRNAWRESISFRVDFENIATVDGDGVVTPNGYGEVTVTAIARDWEGNVISESKQKIIYGEPVPSGWVDFDLPSGTLWKEEPEATAFWWSEAKVYKDVIPSFKEWAELVAYCYSKNAPYRWTSQINGKTLQFTPPGPCMTDFGKSLYELEAKGHADAETIFFTTNIADGGNGVAVRMDLNEQLTGGYIVPFFLTSYNYKRLGDDQFSACVWQVKRLGE